MNMIANIFLTILGMSLTAAYCILAVCLLRVLLRKMPKIFSYCLWSVVALRLVCPILPESRFSLMGDRVVESARQIASTNMEYELESGTKPMTDGLGGDIVPNASEIHDLPKTENVGESGSENVNAINDDPSGEVEGDSTTLANVKETSGNPQAGEIESGNIIHFAAAIWLGIFVLLCAYGIGSYLRLKMRLAKVAYTGRTFENIPVKYAPGIETPFVLGLVRPIVYLPDTLTDSEAMQCLSHERVHVQRRDYLVKQFAFVLACVHWFNPFVWLAFHLMSQDMEMSCDEQALQSPALADRKAYSDTLLKVSTGRVQFGGCPLAFGENSASIRIKNIMNYKKPGFWVVVVACVAIVTCMVGLFTNPVNGTTDETTADIEAKIDKDLDSTQGEPTDETTNNVVVGTESQNNTLADIEQHSIGPVQAQYEAELVDIMKKNLENNYLKQIGIREASIRTLEDVQMENKEKLAKLQNNLDAARQDSTGAEAKNADKIFELQTKIAELNKNAEWDAFFMKETSAEKAALELRLQKMDITDMDGHDVNLAYSADKYLNQPEINCFLMQNFNTSQIDLDFLFYDGAGLESSTPSAEELRLLEDTVPKELWDGNIFYHFTGEQVDSFLMEKLGLPLSEIQCGTGSGNTLKDSWEYLEEYDSYTLFGPKGDKLYTEVECFYAFEYYNGILRLDYTDKQAKIISWYAPLVKGSLYLAPKDAKNSDVNHLNSYYIIGNVLHDGVLKDQNSDNVFILSEYLNRLK